MKLPTACYRLQFRNGMDFDRAIELVPYLSRLGVSHLYASPLFTAQSGSTHGYDVTDQGQIDPVLGGRDGLERLSTALKAKELGLILDIVPNHMAFSTETPWLRDVLRRGQASPYARHFDTDPAMGRIRLPWLTAPFEHLLRDHEIAVEDDDDGPVMAVGGVRVPLAPDTVTAEARAGKSDALRALHSAQVWRLVHWRTESDVLSHRRFFNIAGLIGVRVEDPAVFDDVHRLLFDLVDEGIVNGIRIDHIDGLIDPDTYLRRLRDRAADVPIWVEKILTGNETLPTGWPVQGTTGYVASRSFARALTDPAGHNQVVSLYRVSTARTRLLVEESRGARRQIMTRDLAAELWTLHRLLARLAASHPVGSEFGDEALRNALLAFIAEFPQYRTYTTRDAIPDADAALIRDTATRAAAAISDPGALRFLAEMLTRPGAETAALRLRLQQVTGAAVAKSQEDTVFYRAIRVLSANEVGSEPDDLPLTPDAFHERMSDRAHMMPYGLTLTSSHDTKRSEDGRMRIAAITHAPDAFAAWHAICAKHAPKTVDDNTVWYVAQSALALDAKDGDIATRLADHVVKALREAKEKTFWTDPDEAFETAARGFAADVACAMPEFADVLAPIHHAADRLSLVQAALKLTVPGIPDIYQGTELSFYALTDPDNRRPVDYDLRRDALDDPARLGSALDRRKLDLTRRLLALRRGDPELVLLGCYIGVEAPQGILCFERRAQRRRLRVALAVKDVVDRLDDLREGCLVWPLDEEDREAPVRIWLAVN